MMSPYKDFTVHSFTRPFLSQWMGLKWQLKVHKNKPNQYNAKSSWEMVLSQFKLALAQVPSPSRKVPPHTPINQRHLVTKIGWMGLKQAKEIKYCIE